MAAEALLATDLPYWPRTSGKVRDIYDLGDRLLLVATDRVSAFDWVLPTGIPDKGRILTQISRFWFQRLNVPNHLLTVDLSQLSELTEHERDVLRDRSMIVRKTQVVPIECVVRGYLSGSAWTEYCQSGAVCGIDLPPGLLESARLPDPIFTPATKASSGHDENISFDEMRARVGAEVAEELRARSLEVYCRAAEWARERGILIADTKLEWGWENGRLILIDEVLTPDSSRFWPVDDFQPGRGQRSFDKQFIRDWLQQSGWDKNSPPPQLPDEVVERTRERYLTALEMLTGTWV